MDLIGGQALAPVQEAQLDQEAAAHDLAAEPLDQLAQRACGAAGGEQIVVYQHPRPAAHRVGVQLEPVGAVLQQVLRADRLVGELARLACQRKPRADSSASAGPSRKPRASAATTHSTPSGRAYAASARTARRNASGSASSGAMSLNTIPRLGKSGMSRIKALRSGSPVASAYLSAALPGSPTALPHPLGVGGS